jgi:hypothetical protein
MRGENQTKKVESEKTRIFAQNAVQAFHLSIPLQLSLALMSPPLAIKYRAAKPTPNLFLSENMAASPFFRGGKGGGRGRGKGGEGEGGSWVASFMHEQE